MISPIVKGFLIGSSLGVLAAIFGITESLPRSILLGSFGGIFAGVTTNYRLKRKQEATQKSEDS